MNTCKYCGFTGNPEEFRNPSGRVCKECRKEQKRKQSNKRYRDSPEKVKKQQKKYQQSNKDVISEQKKEHYKNNRDEIRKRQKEDYENHREQRLKKQNKYYRDNRERICEQATTKRRKNGILPWTEIKHLRLGLYVEQVVASMFGSVTESLGNPDVDFICPQGYKIQVKVSSKRFIQNKSPSWGFNIKKNKIADHFILVAVNNIDDIDKEDFKPLYIWLMEGCLLNHKAKTSIALPRLHKWDKYSIMEEYENKFITCCDAIKENKAKDIIK